VTDELKKRLLEDVVIFSGKEEVRTGAELLAPDHSPRERYRTDSLPVRGAVHVTMDLQRQVEQFLFYQAELLDTKNWQAYIDLFATEGVYWMPARPEQTEWMDSPSIFAEDPELMSVRMGRITHPNAWSQAPLWATNHLVANVVIEDQADAWVRVRSRFQVQELRRDAVRSLAGVYRHTLLRRGEDFHIELQRVDLMNAQAPFDYTLQAWV
jgi:3-phenylpropionate/cinnamic acid dioxygenase small subunit